MNKNNILLTISVLFLFGCASYEPKYRNQQEFLDTSYPAHKELAHRFLLVGDAGYAEENGKSDGMKVFGQALEAFNVKNSHTLFLGDNIYPDGMPEVGDPGRDEAEYRMGVQIEASTPSLGEVVFIPGNHDWYHNRIHSLKEQRDFIAKHMPNKKDTWAPKTGCGFEVRDISDDVALIILDTQWYLENWDKSPTINDNCPEIKTREAFLQEFESELKKNQNKNVVVATHHPLYTNGVHGGTYPIERHLYPSQKTIPLPILGSLAALIRTTGGVSIQDAQNERYKSMVDRLSTIAHEYENVIFVSGHEHNLQYNIFEGVHQIVSGSGSKLSYANLRNTGLFAYPGQGIAVYDIFKDGSTFVRFYNLKEGKLNEIYRKEVFPPRKSPDRFIKDFTKYKQKFIKASIYKNADQEKEKNKLFTSIWGNHYRDLYYQEIQVPVAFLDTLYGGLKVVRAGGGHQTKSLRLEDKQGRDYNLRALKKNALQFLQTVAFKDKKIKDDFKNTLAQEAIEDFYTAAHPYGFLVVPTLAKAIGVAHTNPKLFYIPKQATLGNYNDEYGDEIYMLVERPEDDWVGSGKFNNPNKDIQSSSGLFEHLRRDEEYKLDESAYIRARLFDMLLGDWDRHQDQWRWGENKMPNGDKVFYPIPRDRDQVFSNYDGAFFATVRGIAGFANQFGTYEPMIKDLAWFNSAAAGLDRTLIQNQGKGAWIQQSKFIQQNLKDEDIEIAFKRLPKEIYQHESTKYILETLKKRRDNIAEIAINYYAFIAKLAIVTATDKDDFIDITRLKNGDTRIAVYRNIKGKRKYLVSDKVYRKSETNEIWVYGLDDDDEFLIDGKGRNPIHLKIIGGQNNDIYKVYNKYNLKIYDHKSLPNTFDEAINAKIRLTDSYEINNFDKDKRIYNASTILPALGYNPDDGAIIGLQGTYTINKFKRNPYSSQYKLKAGYYFATKGFDLEGRGEWANIFGNYNLWAKGRITSHNFAVNYFGLGNNTQNQEYTQDKSFDFNRVKLSRREVEVGAINRTPFGSIFEGSLGFETVELDDSPNRYISEIASLSDPNLFERKYFAKFDASYTYESYDNYLNPSRGMKFKLNLGATLNTKNTERYFGRIEPSILFYNAISTNRKLVLKTHLNSKVLLGDDFEFYQGAQLGGDNGLRGYRNERFTGESFLVTGADLRYSFNQFTTRFLPFQIGVFGGADLGRVWLDGEESSKWHPDYGGGVFITSANAVNGTLNLFHGDEGWRFSFGFGVSF
ncbi:BamA/TamA family outer membrane protein [Mesonia sp. HuA40]|uniref:metallophosphoesterase n=1 Tax=Mesonia sp. HuA40 TaxID=2602761 RepID=UPI0011C7CCCE|nr:BamA/TamA family outer membrane protein [Mesonia sp. HuA40]TXK71103.1 BamA/TamA family outer membrane protein [Mesonia sp. HuA40]